MHVCNTTNRFKYKKRRRDKKILIKSRNGTQFWPQNIAGISAKLRRVGRGAGGLLFHSFCGPVERKKALDVGGPSFDRFYLFLEVE
jgi:hypothetical protein